MRKAEATHLHRDPGRFQRIVVGWLAGLDVTKPQRRVQTSPRIMKVAVAAFPSTPPMFGQFASSQTVFRLSPSIICLISR